MIIFCCSYKKKCLHIENIISIYFREQLSDENRRVLFALLERYCLAVEGLAFPLPQGFPSFLAYLGYRTLPFHTFLQYVKANVLQLQIDVMKAIMKGKPVLS